MTDTFTRFLTSIPKGGYKRLVLLMFLLFWAASKYSAGDRLLAALVLICLVCILFRIPYLIPIAVAAVVIVLFRTPIMDTGLSILTANRSVLENPKPALTDLLVSRAGEFVLPREARFAIDLMNAHQVDTYQMSARIQQDPFRSQRLIEGTWPKRMEESSPYLILLIEEQEDYPACTIIDMKKDVALGYCP